MLGGTWHFFCHVKDRRGGNPGIICSGIITGMDLTDPMTPYPLQHSSDFLKDIFQFRKFPGKEPLFSESLKLFHFHSVLFAHEPGPSRLQGQEKCCFSSFSKILLCAESWAQHWSIEYGDNSKWFTLLSISCNSVRQILCLHSTSEVVLALKYRSQPSKLKFAVGYEIR